MWFGTEDGLNRYNGYEFKVYKPRVGDPTTISDIFVLSIFEDKDKTLWIGTRYGLDKFDRKTGSFTRYLHDANTPVNLIRKEVNAIDEDHEGKLWIGTGLGLYRFDPGTNQIELYSTNNNKLNCNDVRAVLVDKSGVPWIGTFGDGLSRFDQKSGKFIPYKHKPMDPHSLSSDKVLTIFEDSADALWIGTEGGGLSMLNRDTGRFIQYRRQENGCSLSHNDVTTICEDKNGILWIGTYGGGINTFDRKTGKFTCYKYKPGVPHSLSYDYILSIYEDKSGLIWIGSYGRGLDIYDRNIQDFSLYVHNPADPSNSLSDNTIWSICEGRSGILWIGTECGGLNKFDRKNGKFKHYKTQNSDLKTNGIRSICEDKKGILWIGNYRGGLYRFDPGKELFKHYHHETSNESLSDDGVMLVFQDRAGDLWIGTNGGGLNKMIDQEKGTFKHYNTDNNNINHDRIFSIYEDRTGILWVGTFGGGLNKYDKKNDQFIHYLNIPGNSESLSHNRVRCIHEDRYGTLWIGTGGGGLNKMVDREKGYFKVYRKADGLPNDVIYGILEGPKGNLWLSTNNGISRFNPETGNIRNYDVHDGLQSNEFNTGAYFKSPGIGEMFFGGISGLNSFFPDQIEDDPYVPAVVFTDFLLSNKSVPLQRVKPDSPLQKPIHETDALTLSYKQNFFSFEFAALHYASPMRNKYKYKLDEWDKTWIETDAKNRRATYTNLPAGNYTFKVKGSNKDGVWNEEGTSIKIKILPPPWKTWWAYLIYGLILALIVFRFVRSRKILAKKVEERTKELRDTQGQLVQSEKMASLGFLVAGVAHEINNPSSFAHTSAYNLERDIEKLKAFLIELAGDDADKEILNAFDDKFNVLFNHLTTIKEGTSRISKTVSDLRTFSRMEKGEMKPIKILECLQVTLNMVRTLYKEKIEFVKDFQADTDVEGIAAELNQVFINILVNACNAILERQKRTGEEIMGTLTIQTMEENEHAVIRFQDTGVGMSEEVKQKMFDPFFTTRLADEGTGLGLFISYGIVQKHKGRFEVVSKEGKGTTVTLYLPLLINQKYRKKDVS
jgi:ligand-binding sensor domain-containing protein/signal transduction histidine kinase